MKNRILSTVALTALLCAGTAAFADDKPNSDKAGAEKTRPHFFTPEEKTSEGSVVTNHQR